MNNPFTTTTTLLLGLWGISAILDYLFFIYYLQLKEYRYDRFRDFLSTKQGKSFLSAYPIFWRGVVALGLFFLLRNVLSFHYIAFLVLILDIVYNTFRFLFKGRPKLPIFTHKTISILAISLLFEGILVYFVHTTLQILPLLAFRFFLILFLVTCLRLPNTTLKLLYVALAKRKMKALPHLTVIGITGSFGKSSVKSFLTQILSGKFQVITTPGNINTEIGVAKFILKTNFRNKEIFVVEMGAYRTGEIKLISDMVKPKIGILTGINEQHLSLFGSIKNTQTAKYELLRSLPKNGLAVVNSDSFYARELLSELTCAVETYGVDEEFNPTCLIKDISKSKNGIRCIGRYKDLSGEVSIPLFGSHHALNVAACTPVAFFLGMEPKVLQRQIENLKSPEKGIHILRYGSAIILDDSYNSNPDGFRSALELLSSYPSEYERIVITRGMLELGDKSREIHQKIGEEIDFVADQLVVITSDFYDDISKGVGRKLKTTIKKIEDPEELLTYIRSYKDTEAVILLENRVFTNITQELASAATPL